MGQILSQAMRKYLLNTTKQGYNKDTRSVYNRRIITYAKKGLEDLALLAENLPEDQQAEIFNKEAFIRMIKAVYSVRNRPKMDDKLLSKRKKRILELSYPTLSHIGNLSNAWSLAPTVMKVLTKAGLSETDIILGLKAIYIQSLTQKNPTSP